MLNLLSASCENHCVMWDAKTRPSDSENEELGTVLKRPFLIKFLY